jgi:hypothetical protein
MNGFPQSAPTVTQASHDCEDGSRQPPDLVYQTVTIAAMLLLLGSLWLF